MSRITALDASALHAYYWKESGAEKVIDLFEEADRSGLRLIITAVNWYEVYFKALRNLGRERATAFERACDLLPLDIVSVDRSIAREAAELRNRYGLYHVDAIAAALAKLRKATLLTADSDFKPIEKEVKITWL
ncbi:MAG: PIN domain-containing protein [bacterium]